MAKPRPTAIAPSAAPAAKPAPAKAAPAKQPRGKTPKSMSVADARAFVAALAQANPDPKSDLVYTDPFTLLVAVVLSAQATDAGVNKATPALFAAAPRPAAMAALGAEGIGQHIRSIGLWQGKAKNVAALARALAEQHGGEVPNDREALEALPGVGRKTANVVLNVAFGEPTMAVDTHVFRVGNRTGLAPGKTPRAVEDALVARLPPETLRLAHHWLILHGRYCCKARTPECWRCVAAQWCRYPHKTPPPASKPPAKPKLAGTKRAKPALARPAKAGPKLARPSGKSRPVG
jgi:endonuclease-3